MTHGVQAMKYKQLLTFLSLSLMGTAVYAMPTAGGGALPWDAPLTTLVTSITGPFAFAAATVGMVIAGAILVFGNDLNRFGQSVMYLILVIGLIILGANSMATLFTTGATISASTSVIVGSTAMLLSAAMWLTGIQYLTIKTIKSIFNQGNKQKVVTA